MCHKFWKIPCIEKKSIPDLKFHRYAGKSSGDAFSLSYVLFLSSG